MVTVGALHAGKAVELLGAERVTPQGPPLTGSEDFAFMLERVPGSYLLIGNGTGVGGCMVHNPGYDFNDDNIAVGSAYWVLLAERFLAAWARPRVRWVFGAARTGQTRAAARASGHGHVPCLHKIPSTEGFMSYHLPNRRPTPAGAVAVKRFAMGEDAPSQAVAAVGQRESVQMATRWSAAGARFHARFAETARKTFT